MDQFFQTLFEWCVETFPRPWNWITGLSVIAALLGAVIWVIWRA